MKTFVRPDADLDNREIPDPEQHLEAQPQKMRQARELTKSLARKFEQIEEQLSKKERLRHSHAGAKARTIEQLRARLSEKDQQIERLRSGSDARNVEARKYKLTVRRVPKPTGRRERKLVILDDVFPHPLSAFRIAEYGAYLDAWKDAVVFSTASSFPLLRETRSFEEVLGDYTNRYPQFKGRIYSFDGKSDLADSLVYTMFLNNASFFLDVIHACNVPFVVTLYPGGGLQLEQDESDEKLRRVCSSPNLQKVIATQKVVHEYLLAKRFCDPQKIEFIYGGVYPVSLLIRHEIAKRYYPQDKETFDVCFVAHKYMERGADKGYDTFVEAAKLIARRHDDAFFHVVGPFDETDVDIGGLGSRLTFYGTRPTEFFADFYARMDAIVSPNVPFLLLPGAFDIFPLGTCIEAGSCGVAVFCTDPLQQNVAFADGEEIVIVPRDAAAIGETVSWYHEHPEVLRRLSERGREAFRRVFDTDAQMQPRLHLLSELMGRDLSLGETNAPDKGRNVEHMDVAPS